MNGLHRKLSMAVGTLVLAGGLAACTPPAPAPTPVPSPSAALPAGCPSLPPEALAAVRIPQGTSEMAIIGVLDAYASWIGAGTDVANSWAQGSAVVDDACLVGLAEQSRIAYAETIFTTHTDVAWQDYYAGQQELTLQSLRNAVAPDATTQLPGRFELLRDLSSSSTEHGTFLKFDAVYRPPSDAPVDPLSWAGLAQPTRWYVELVPFDGHLIINYVEQSPAAGY